MTRIVLAYSGRFDTTVAIPWLAEQYQAEVVAVTVDLGLGRDLEEVRDRALAAGAVRAHVLDVREEFAKSFILPALKAGASQPGRSALGTALARPLMAKTLIEIAAIERADAVAHGCAGDDGDERPFDEALHGLSPNLAVLAPVRDWGMTRPETIEYARRHGIPAPAAVGSPYRAGATLWGRSVESSSFDGPWVVEAACTLTRAPRECPDRAAFVDVSFEQGVPVAINGVVMPLVELIASLNTIAGAHGVGRAATVGKGGVSEAPAATVLHTGHDDLQETVSTRDTERVSRAVASHYAELVHGGRWFTPLREALDAYVEKIQERVTGVVRLQLSKGECRVVARNSPFAIYDWDPAARGAAGLSDPAAGAGPIRMLGTRGQ